MRRNLRTRPDGSARCGTHRVRLRRLLHGSRAALLLAAGLLLVGVCYLKLLGLPAPLVRSIEASLWDLGWPVHIDRVYLSFRHGLVAEQVTLARDSEHGLFEAEARRMIFLLTPSLRSVREGLFLRGVRIQEGALRPGTAAREAGIVFDDVVAEVRRTDQGLFLRRFEAHVLGVKLSAQGMIFRPEGYDAAAWAQSWRQLVTWPSIAAAHLRPEPWRATVHDDPAWIRAAGWFSIFDFAQPPELEIGFSLHPEKKEANHISLYLNFRQGERNGFLFDGGFFEAQWDGRRVEAMRARVRHGAREAFASGSYDPSEGLLQVRLSNMLPLEAWEACLPAVPLRVLKRSGFHSLEKAECRLRADASCGQRLTLPIAGRVTLARADCMGAWIQEAEAQLYIDHDVLTLTELNAVVGSESGRGPLEGEFHYDHRTRLFEGRGEGSFDPREALTLMPPAAAEVVSELRFDARKPSFTAVYAGGLDQVPLSFDGRAEADAVIFRGVELSSLRMGLAYGARKLRMTGVEAERSEGFLRGDLSLDLEEHVARVDMRTSFHPYAVAGLLGPAVEDEVRSYRFDGPAAITARGTLDYRRFEKMSARGQVELEQAAYERLAVDTLRADWHADGNTILLQDVEGRAYGGRFSGEGRLHPDTASGAWAYETSGRVNKLCLQTLLTDMGDDPETRPQGTIDGWIQASGLAGKGQGQTVLGEGHLSVQGDRLLRLPLFGPLSRFLAYIYPGLGFLSQTDFHADYEIADGRFHSRNALLEGNVITLSAEGSYTFDDRLDFNVQLSLLRPGFFSSLLRMVTFPVSKLFEFQLRGTPSEPVWRPANLPKELFLIFD